MSRIGFCWQCLFSLMLAFVLVLLPAAAAENWPAWRGPTGSGTAAVGDYPVEFSTTQNVKWQLDLPGAGSSTPAVWEDKIFVTCGIDGHNGVLALDFAGNELWRHTLGEETQGKHRYGSGSNPSPVTDGEHLVVYYKSGELACLDLQGNERWQHNLVELYGPIDLWWDLGSSPVLAGDKVIIAMMHAGDSYLAAFDLETGEVAWHTPRQYQRPPESDQAYTTPQLVSIDGRQLIVTFGADHLTGHDVATGEFVFDSGGLNPENEGMWRVIASAAIGDDVAVVPFGRGEFVAGIRLGGQGDITESNRLWTERIDGPDVPTPVVEGETVIVLGDAGDLTCLNLQSGQEQWSAKIPGNRRTKYYASPVLAGGMLFCAREDGLVVVGRVNENGYQQLAANEMDETLIATPVPIRGGLLVRGEEHLYFVGPGNTVTGG